MSDDARLTVVLEAKIDKLIERLGAANKAVAGSGAKIQKTLDQIDSRWDKLFGKGDPGKALDEIFSRSRLAVIDAGAARIPIFGSAIEELGPLGLAAAAGLGALALAAHQTVAAMQFADELGDTANKLHITTDALQEYRYALRLAGGEEKEADEALGSFSVTLGKAQEGLPKALKGFQALGFTRAQIDSFKTVEEGLTAVTTRIAGLKSDVQKDAITDQLGLKGLAPLINEGVAEMAKLRQEAHEVGIVMSDDLIKRAGEANDKYETLSKVVDVQLKSAFVDLAPVLVGLLGLAADLAKEFADIASNFQAIQNRSTEALRRKRDQLKEGIEGDRSTAFLPGGKEYIAHRQAKLDKINAELARREAEAKANPPAKPSGGTGLIDVSGAASAAREARERALAELSAKRRVSSALASAEERKLEAELGGGRALEEELAYQDDITALRRQQRDQLLDDQLTEYKLSEGKRGLSEAQAREIKEANQRADDAEDATRRYDKVRALADQALELARDHNSSMQQEAGIRSRLARTVFERYQIEAKALEEAQRRERDELEHQIRFDPKYRNADGADERARADLDKKQAAERSATFRTAVDDYKAGLLAAFDAARGKAGDLADFFGDRIKAKLIDGLAEIAAKQLLDLQGKGGGLGKIAGFFGSLIGKNADGTDSWRGGLTWVGERGRELVNLPKGSQVIPNHVLGNLGNMRVGGRATTVIQPLHLDLSGAVITEDLLSQVNSRAAQAAALGATGGRMGARSDLTSRARNAIP